MNEIRRMKFRYSLRSVLVAVAAVSMILAVYYYWAKGDSIYYRTKSGFICRVFTDEFFCDQAEGVYCEIRIGSRLVVPKIWIDALDCSRSLARPSYEVYELDGGEGVVVFSARPHDRPFAQDAVRLVYTKNEGLMHSNFGQLPRDVRRNLVDRFFPSTDGSP